MCGIVGTYGREDTALVTEMLPCIEHRGPDEAGQFVDEDAGVAMGARRLSIVDLAGGSQPIYNEDSSVVVVFNGEIYNHRSLRADLEAKGHTFQTDSDTETLVHLWEEHGERCPEFLNGMFAFSIYDRDRDALFLARDRLGIKPLYYSATGAGFTWGSEVNALLAGGVARDIDPQSVYSFFALGYTPRPRTLFAEIQKVQPGTSLFVTDGGTTVSQRRYWSLPSTLPGEVDHMASAQRVSNRVRELLERSVERRLMADVPVGSFLSGGLDSSAVVGLLSQHVEDLRTFSVGFQGGEYDESDEAQFVADHFGTDHTTVEVDLSAMDVFGDAVRQYGEPLADPAILPTLLLSDRASDDLKVVHTGEGADELFAGYSWFRSFDESRARVTGIPEPLFEPFRLCASLLPDGRLREKCRELYSLRSDATSLTEGMRSYPKRPKTYLDIEPDETDDGTDSFDEIAATAFAHAKDDRLQRMTAYQLLYPLTDRLLYKVDHATMAHSLEARVPYLDHELVEFAYNIPGRFKREAGYKPILNQAVADLVPKRTRNRTEHGFGVPTSRWFRNDHEAIERYLSTERMREVPHLDAEYVQAEWAAHRRGQQDLDTFLWRCLNYVAWYHEIARPD
jgi:asparagine synthase (glutamine-hydrolysing)